MDQLIAISPAAAAQPPSKMGFPPGTQLTLDNALKIIMVKSANDIAAAIAENLGGSIEGFAVLMNEAAVRVGMRESRWVNPHGLPADGQQTSARDMAILGRALLREFPDRRDLFSIGAIRFGSQIVPNHNGLLGRYPGMDGMKTGFICPSGFNVVASASRDGRQLVTIVLGSPSARERTLEAADLFERGFASLSGRDGSAQALSSSRSLEDLPASNRLAPPDMRSVICGGRRPPKEDSEAIVAGAPDGKAGPASRLPPTGLAFAGFGANAAWKTQALPPRAPLRPVLVWLGRDPADAVNAAAEERAAARASGGRGRRKLAAHPEPAAARPETARRAAPRKRVAQAARR
jgi:D-alanyl-D-alanine carboxypeptidase